jgi:hypothetical protein
VEIKVFFIFLLVDGRIRISTNSYGSGSAHKLTGPTDPEQDHRSLSREITVKLLGVAIAETLIEDFITLFSFLQKVFCGHEYSLQNLAFGLHVEPANRDIQDKIAWCRWVPSQ